MKLVGFGCKAQVGKDTAADYLRDNHEGARVAFADKVKEVAMELYELSHEQCYGPKEIKEAIDPRYGKSPRELMQKIGDGLRKILGKTVWIDAVFNVSIPEAIQDGAELIVISDVRYPNEGDRIRKEAGHVIRVDRTQGGTSVGADHPSETSMDNYQFDFVIENNGSLEDYHSNLDQLMEAIGYRRNEENNSL